MAKIKKSSANELAKICLWAYDFDETTHAARTLFNGKPPISTVEVFDNERTPTSFAAVLEYEKVVVIAFQGTITKVEVNGQISFSTMKDWVQNFKVKQVDTSKSGLPGKVHFGFQKQLNLIYEKVKLSIPSGTKKSLVLTGHSQGGAVAVLATKKLELDGYKVKDTYTFAAPRTGDRKFASSITTPVFRVEFGHDLVPHVPPALNKRSLLSVGLDSLSKLIDLPEPLEAFLKLTKRLRDNSYQSVGVLTYGKDTGEVVTDLAPNEEAAIFKKRKRKLFAAGKSLGAHHHLANYISMFQ